MVYQQDTNEDYLNCRIKSSYEQIQYLKLEGEQLVQLYKVVV